jgi:hypothetical protein
MLILKEIANFKGEFEEEIKQWEEEAKLSPGEDPRSYDHGYCLGYLSALHHIKSQLF